MLYIFFKMCHNISVRKVRVNKTLKGDDFPKWLAYCSDLSPAVVLKMGSHPCFPIDKERIE